MGVRGLPVHTSFQSVAPLGTPGGYFLTVCLKMEEWTAWSSSKLTVFGGIQALARGLLVGMELGLSQTLLRPLCFIFL